MRFNVHYRQGLILRKGCRKHKQGKLTTLKFNNMTLNYTIINLNLYGWLVYCNSGHRKGSCSDRRKLPLVVLRGLY